MEFKLLSKEEYSKLSYVERERYTNSFCKIKREYVLKVYKDFNKDVLKPLGFKRKTNYVWLYDLGWTQIGFEMFPIGFIDTLIFRPYLMFLWENPNIGYIDYYIKSFYDGIGDYKVVFGDGEKELDRILESDEDTLREILASGENELRKKLYVDIKEKLEMIITEFKSYRDIHYAKDKLLAYWSDKNNIRTYRAVLAILFLIALNDGTQEEIKDAWTFINDVVHTKTLIERYGDILINKDVNEIKQYAISSIYETRNNPKNKKYLSIKNYVVGE